MSDPDVDGDVSDPDAGGGVGDPDAEANGRTGDEANGRTGTEGRRTGVRAELVRFVRALRRGGAGVPANAATTGARALAEVGLGDRERARTALRASLLSDSDDFDLFDRLFEQFWRRLETALEAEQGGGADDEGAEDTVASLETPESEMDPPSDAEETLTETIDESVAGTTPPGTGSDNDDGPTRTALYSPSGETRAVDGDFLTDAVELSWAMRDLTRSLAGLQGRRYRPGDDRTDVRRTLRASMSTGGTVLSVPKRERRRTAVRALLLVDVSRSVLDAVDRGFLIDVLRLACREWRDVRVFFFDEDLREVTGSMDASSATAALDALDAAETAWGGGTRIGGSLARLRERMPDAVDRDTVTFVVSDGLEMGDVSDLERELSWIARRAKRVLWLNPLAASDDYEPTARGMAAALPYVDGLFAFATPDDVREMARQLRRHGPGGRIGYEFEPGDTPGANGRTTPQSREHS